MKGDSKSEVLKASYYVKFQHFSELKLSYKIIAVNQVGRKRLK